MFHLILAIISVQLCFFLCNCATNLSLCDEFENDPPVLTPLVYKSWPNLHLRDRLKYLLDIRDLKNLFADFLYLSRSRSEQIKYRQNVYCPSAEETATFAQISNQLAEFLAEDEITLFLSECDINHNSEIDFMEYVLCRGSFDMSGHLQETDEYDKREQEVKSAYESKLYDSGRLPQYIYDENGIIIDEIEY